MPIPKITPPPININNPSKEIFGASGIYYTGPFPLPPPPGNNGYYWPDIPNSPLPNTGELKITVPTTTPDPNSPHALDNADLTFGGFYVDDMLVFNNYIHYSLPLKMFNPQSFLQQSVVAFNMYNLGNRQ